MLSVIDGYTRGTSDTAISLARARGRGVSEEEWAAAVGADLGRAIGEPRFPNLAAIGNFERFAPPAADVIRSVAARIGAEIDCRLIVLFGSVARRKSAPKDLDLGFLADLPIDTVKLTNRLIRQENTSVSSRRPCVAMPRRGSFANWNDARSTSESPG
jgi:hypothetical protein